jgi:exodeoxyribonuclease-5
MELTKRQQEGLKVAVLRYQNKEKYTCISGYAGSGKSTLVKFIIQSLPGVDPETDVVYATFTGKAAQVLLKKGNKNVSTLHKLLYESLPRPDGTWYRKPVERIPYKIVVVDEVSMVPQSMINQLFKYHIYLLALGDPFQLPPINKDDVNTLLDKPHVFLNEIMRQAQESEIIRVSMDIREGKSIDVLNGSEVKIFKAEDFEESMLLWADQVLVATNQTRINLNNTMRQLLNREGGPQEGDKVICLKNDWANPNAMGDVMVNGSIGTIHNFQFDSSVHPLLQPGLILNFKPDYAETYNDNFNDLLVDYRLLLKGENTVNKNNFNIFKRIARPKELDYAYAITCHKSQGSEYDKVLVLEEWLKGGDHARWLYTAATRAKEKLVIVRDYK